MWASFFLCTLIFALVLYGPGYILLRGCGLRRALALGAAPIACCLGLGLLGIAWGQLGVPCSWATMFMPVLVVYGVVGVAGRCRRNKQALHGSSSFRADFTVLALYVAIGLIVCGYIFVKSLDTPESFYCRFDNQTHDNLVRHFIDSGDWSALHHTSGALSLGRTPTYYPSAWHGLAALAFSMTGLDLAIIFNALNALLAGVVYPVSSFALMTVLFPRRHSVVIAGAVTTMAFACLPWVLLLKGQLLANLISFSLAPAACALIAHYVQNSPSRHWRGLLCWSLALVAFFWIAHPNGLFTVLVFVAPLVIRKAADALHESRCLSAVSPLRKRWVVWALGVAVCYILWQLMLYAPPLQQVVLYNNTANLNLTWSEGLYAAAAFSLYPDQPPQWLLFAACVIGAVLLVRKGRGWLALPGAYMLLVYAACRCTEASYTLRTFLAGFWYSDPYRVLCCAELFLVPVAAVGLAGIAQIIVQLAKGPRHNAALALTLVVFSVTNFFPCFIYSAPTEVPDGAEPPRFTPGQGTAIGYMHRLITEGYDMGEEQIYSAEEEAFVRRVMDIVPEDALVVNQPHDGSVFAYGLNGLNTYYRHIDTGDEAGPSPIIRERLADIATDAEVAEAVREADAQYVLQLDHDAHLDEGVWLLQTNEEAKANYAGIDAIDDDTPGFEVVLEEGDMRLYRIKDTEEPLA